ncbi:hypothetical protein DW077_12220 [Phocaeicola vulgatus]|nr:hypothetical protein DW077_12220 [Phocaeicola vulgatus]
MTSTVFSAQFENLGELVKNLIFPVGVDTFPTELSGSSAMSFLRQGQVRKPHRVLMPWNRDWK